MKLLLHSSTERAVADFIESPSHAVLITGQAGAGKGSLAAYIAASLLKKDAARLEEYPYLLWMHDGEKGVSIEQVRAAQTFMQLKTPGAHGIRRILIVEQGDTMSIEAQNAFLKLLEEPPNDTVIIITASNTSGLLPTIHSRVQSIRVLPVSIEQGKKFYSSDFTPPAIQKAYFLSEGYMGLMTALLKQDTDHELVAQIAIAKEVLAATTYDRLARVDALSKQKNIGLLLLALERVCHASLTQAIQSNNSSVTRWTKRLKTIVQAESDLTHNPNGKLLLTNLMLNL